ncbi:hypothetical protein TUM12370_10840 [Salmonella enterica subsp. enterica serovar Choleraesuis]|nr:hypothetical protein TUM12370_10840 [Salmonella enterica subsp. enterica serovar Choleraesuis]
MSNTANETPVCCCTDIGTVIDNTDCVASYSHVFATRAEADAMLEQLTAKAREVESEPAQITPRFTQEADGVRLDIDFNFACQAETVIFQLGLR